MNIFKDAYSRVGCWLYGHHPEVFMAGEAVGNEEAVGMTTIARVTLSRGKCKRCGVQVEPNPQTYDVQVNPVVHMEINFKDGDKHVAVDFSRNSGS